MFTLELGLDFLPLAVMQEALPAYPLHHIVTHAAAWKKELGRSASLPCGHGPIGAVTTGHADVYGFA